MAFSDYLKKYREAQASQTPSSTSSNAISGNTQHSTTGNTQQSTSESSGSGNFRDYLQRYRASQLSTTTIEDWDKSSRELLTYTQDRASNWFDKTEYESLYNKYTTLLSQADGWRRKYAGNTEALSYIDSITSALEGAKKATSEYFRHYAQWGNEDDYNKAKQAYQEFYDQWGYYTDAKDFDQYLSIGNDLHYEDFGDTERKHGKSRRQRGYTSADVYRSAAVALYIHNGGEAPSEYYYNNQDVDAFSHMTDEEFQILSYLIAKDKAEGTNLANQYVDEMYNVVNQRLGYAHYTEIDNIDIPVVEGVAKFGYSVGAGLINSMTGIYQTLGDETLPDDPSEYALQYILESSSGFEKYAYQTASTIGNMLPSMAVSAATGPVGPYAGALVTFASTGGNAYEQALDWGYDKKQARIYGTIVGALEGSLQAVLGGISSLSAVKGKVSSKISAIDKVVPRIMAKLGWSTVKEITEEELQNYLEPLVRTIVLGEEYDAPTIEELLETAIVTALSTGGLEGVGTAVNDVSVAKAQNAQYKADGSSIMGVEGGTDALMNLANEVAGVTGSKSLNRQINKVSNKPTAKNVGKLYNTVQSTNNQANAKMNQQDIAVSLMRNGISTNKANDIAEALVANYNGNELTTKQERLLNSVKDNKAVQDAISDIIENPQSTMGQRNQKVTKFATDIALGMLAKEAGVDLNAIKNTTDGNVTTADEIASESSYEVSEDGKTLDANGNEISIVGIDSVGKGKLTLKLSDGSTIDSSEVVYSSKGEALIYEAVANMDAFVDADTAFKLVKAYDPTSGISAEVYARGLNQAYTYGFYGYKRSDMTANKALSSLLTEEQRNYAYEAGREYAEKYNTGKATGIQDAYATAKSILRNREKNGQAVDKSGSVIFEDGLTRDQITKSKNGKQKNVAYLVAKKVSAKMGNDIHLYKGTKEFGFRAKNGDIWLNVNATADAQSMMLFTLSHELVHNAREYGPKEFKAFADALVEQYGEHGKSVHDMVLAKQADYASQGKKLSYDKAYEEVVCDACERMLLDSNALEKLELMEKKNPGLIERIIEGIRNFLKHIREIFADVSPYADEAKFVKEMETGAQEILNRLFGDMMVASGQHYSTIKAAFGKGTVVETNADGEFTIAKSEDGSEMLYNLATWENGGKETLQEALESEGFSAEDIQAAMTIMDAKYDLVKKIGNEFKEQDTANKATLTTDLKDGHAVLSAIVSNGDYPVNIDLLMVCKKRQAYQRVINRLCETGLIKDATLDSLAIAEINRILGSNGFETACLGCFVESRRLRIQEWANTIVKEWNGLVDKKVGKGNAKAFNFSNEKAFVENMSNEEIQGLAMELDAAYEENRLQYGKTSVVKKMAKLIDEVPSLRRHLSIADLITPEGRTRLRSLSSELNSLVACRYGSNTPKIIQAFNPYNHELAVYGKVPSKYKSLREYLYAIGGARMQSFSDFIIENWFDYCQIVADLSARKLPMHTYTKEIALVKLLGMTGIKINMSLIPDVDSRLSKEYAGLTINDKGELELIWADKDRNKATNGKSYMQSINFADAVAIQNDPRYSSNVGTIAVGISVKQIEMMLDDPRIRMIIPYHSSGMNPIFAHLVGTSYYKDFTDVQNTKVKQLYKNGKPVSLKLTKDQAGKLTSGFEFNEVLQELGDARAAADAYKAWCADASKHSITIDGVTYTAELTPKFSQFADHQNYYKVLEDFNTYDSITEKAAPQGDVTQTYPEDFEDILRAELTTQDKYRRKQEKNGSFDKAMAEIEGYLKTHTKADTVYYAEKNGIKLSDKDKKLDADEKRKLKALRDADLKLSKGEPAPTFYSHMGRVVDGVKQEKLGASSVVSMLRGKGVKAEEIKWSGIEAFLDGKKSVTKAELQEFISGSMLQIEEETLDNKDRPYTEDQKKRLDEYEANRDEVAKRLANEWKKITGKDFPIRNAGAGLESAVSNAIIDFNLDQKKAAFEGRLLEKLRKDLEEVIKNNDDFGFDSWKDALRSIHRHRRDFIKNYEMSTNDKAVIVKYCNALNAYNELPNSISDADTDRLRAIALEADPWNRKIMEVKHEHNEEEAKYMTKWGQYRLEGGKNYREMLFRIPGSTYSNDAMFTHWKERKGVLAHARIQDMDTFIGKMLFIEEIQSDWHNAGHKDGYRDPSLEDKYTLSRKMEKYTEEFFSSPTADMVKEKISPIGYEGAGVSMILNFLIDSQESMQSTLNTLSRKGASFTESEVSEIAKYAREYEEMYHKWETAPGDLTAPDAPFKDTYHEYVMKRLIRMAAEQDYDSIGWTTADVQMNRWNPSRRTNEQMGITDAKNPNAIAFEDGYRIEYDQDIPKFLRKYGKQWDTTVGKTVLDNGTEVWSMAITDTMKDSVLYDGQVMYKLPKVEAITPTNEQVEQNIREVAGMNPVHSVDASKLDKTGKKPSEIFTEFFDNWGWNIHSDELGDIEITQRSVKDEVRHGITAEKIAAIEAIPSVIQQGKIVFSGLKPDTTVRRIVICAPITIGANPYYMGVMLQRDANKQRLYIHNVVIEEETPTFSPANLLTTGANENNERLFITNILQDALNVKHQIKLDKEYMDAVNRGDMETAQRLVDQKAEEVGAKLIYDPDPDGFYVLKNNIPTKWVEAYKVFNMYDGEIYPLYIKNANKTPIPFRTWVGGKEGGRKYEALNGHAYVLGDTGQSHPRSAFSDEVWQQMVDDGVVKPNAKNSPKMLAYRPGWHGTSQPFFPQGGKKDESSNYGKIHTANHVVCKVRFSKDIDLTQAAVDNAPRTKDGRPNMNEADLKYLPQENGKHSSYEYRTNRGIPPEVAKKSKWYVASAMYVESVLTQEEADNILTQSGIPIQEWEGGSLDLAAIGYSQEIASANPKLRDAVTYDDNGNVIPLSERFNASKNDVRYKLPNTLRDTQAAATMEALEKQNEKLREDVSYLKELLKIQRSVTGGKKITRSSVEIVARNLKKEMGAKGNSLELAGHLNQLYSFIAESDELTWEGIVEKAQPAVKWLREHGTVEKDSPTELTDQELLHKVYDGYWNVSTLYTVADVKQKEINKLKAEHMKRMQKLKESHEKSIANLKEQQKQRIEDLREFYHKSTDKKLDAAKERYQEQRQRGIENRNKTEMRKKIRKVIRDLDKILNRGNKKTNVKEDMKGFVSKALELADYLFTDHISNDDLILKGITVRMTQKEAALVKETEEIISQLYNNADSLTDEEFTRLDAKRKNNLDKLRDLLTAQRNEMLNTPVYNLFNDLVTEYANLNNSKQDAVKAAYNPNVERFLRSYIGESDGETDSKRKTLLQNMRVADMTMDELWKLHNAYTMVLHSVRYANKLWVKGKTETIEQITGRLIEDFSKRKTPDGKVGAVIRNLSNKLGWNYEKLYYALDRIGSKTFYELVMNIANSENIVMQDIIEATAFRDEIVEKYGYNNWDVNKKIDREFLDNTGKKFKLTLGELMSLYAYSRRDGAWDHIEYGGFVFGKAALTNPRPADSYKLSKEQCEAITNTLTNEQKAYAEDMQKFLSETMGAKGNEVSMLMYGITMFDEKNYFPIHIAGQFKAQASESQAKAASGFSSMSNAGFTHAQNPNAKAPFVLEGFNEIWADHVNEMSRYHGTVPALEDMRRVMNRSFYSESGAESIAVKQLMENSFGKDAVEYFDNLYREANSGAITEKLQEKSHKLLSMFRKNSVAYSLSVLVQQPTSIVRACAMIDIRYFGFKGFGAITSGIAKAVTNKWTKAHTNAYNEMLKYAPGVTMAKEIGGFDTATGGSIRSYLLDTNKSLKQKLKTGNIAEKGKAVMDLVDDNAIANLPNMADKITWIEIWNACKRETLAKHKHLAPNSEEFMQVVGDRFTEVIRATQVYDSIFAKSPMLKSKNLAVQYLVSFMNEPNTVANMAESAVRNIIRGDWKDGVKKGVVLICGIAVTNIVKSIIYAMRDDDEDETYIEKYIEAVTGNMINDFNPLNYIPIARDVWSLAQGYDVERADMAILADAIDAIDKVIKNATKDTEGMTEDQLIELDKQMTEANWKLVESLAALFGIPVKNIRREINGVLDHISIASANAGKTTKQSAWDKVRDSVIDSIPFMQNNQTKGDKLYDAILNGDDAYLKRLREGYDTETAYNTAVRKALRENDPRIKEAAEARFSGDFTRYKKIFLEIQGEGNFSFDTIMGAVNAEVNELEKKAKNGTTEETTKADEDETLFTVEHYYTAVVGNDQASAKLIYDDLIAEKLAEGYLQHEAEDAIASGFATQVGKAYMDGEISRSKALQLLEDNTDKGETDVKKWDFELKYGFSWGERVRKYRLGQISERDLISAVMDIEGESREAATEYIEFLDLEMANENFDITANDAAGYFKYAEPAGIDVEVYLDYKDKASKCESDKDANGKPINGSYKAKVMDVINSLPITSAQKDALYLANGWAASKINEAPWH